MEVIDLQSTDSLKDKYIEGNLMAFYKCFPSDQFAYLRKLVCEFILVFGITYLCKNTFSKMKYTKCCNRSQVFKEYVNSLLNFATTRFEPQLDIILSEINQLRVSPNDQSQKNMLIVTDIINIVISFYEESRSAQH